MKWLAVQMASSRLDRCANSIGFSWSRSLGLYVPQYQLLKALDDDVCASAVGC